MNSFTRSITTSEADIDILGHVNNAVWVRWIQDMATAHWDAVAPQAWRDAYIWVVTRHEIDYPGNVGAGELVAGRTWISEAPKGARFDRNVEFTDSAGKVIVKAVTTWAFIERASGRVRRVPGDLVQLFMD